MRKKWRAIVETANGSIRYRWANAECLDGAADAIRDKIPVRWRIVAIEEVPLDEPEIRCGECGEPGHSVKNCKG
jgi:hypothetical protein